MAAGDLDDLLITRRGPSLEPVFGRLPEASDAALRARIVAAGRRLTGWVLTTDDDPPWSLDAFILVDEGGSGAVSASLRAGEGRTAVDAAIALRTSQNIGGVWEVSLAVRTDCRCQREHWDLHLLASQQVDAHRPTDAVAALDDLAAYTIEHLPGRTTAEWIALGVDEDSGYASLQPDDHRQWTRDRHPPID
jgi:hypothetical protein